MKRQLHEPDAAAAASLTMHHHAVVKLDSPCTSVLMTPLQLLLGTAHTVTVHSLRPLLHAAHKSQPPPSPTIVPLLERRRRKSVWPNSRPSRRHSGSAHCLYRFTLRAVAFVAPRLCCKSTHTPLVVGWISRDTTGVPGDEEEEAGSRTTDDDAACVRTMLPFLPGSVLVLDSTGRLHVLRLPERDSSPNTCNHAPQPHAAVLVRDACLLRPLSLARSCEGAAQLTQLSRQHTSDISTSTPSSLHLEKEYRAGGRVLTPSRIAPPVGRHQLHTQGSSTY